ncbi:MAG TPA: hypothetical protein VMU13_00480, partial [Candidatus Paceibacterota bacterium]|nr:hypothetical protein [Candidatus Paceibacterota bacterium]
LGKQRVISQLITNILELGSRLRLRFADDQDEFLALLAKNRPERIRQIHDRRFARSPKGHDYAQSVFRVLGELEHVALKGRDLILNVMRQKDREEPIMASTYDRTSNTFVGEDRFSQGFVIHGYALGC